MKFKKLIICFLASLVLFNGLIFFGQPTLAADLEYNRARLDQSVNQLLDIKENKDINENEQLVKEIEMRKEIIQKALNLSFAEIENIRNKFEKLVIAKDQVDANRFKNIFLTYLLEAEDYLIKTKRKLEPLNQLDDIKNIAAELKEYREDIYNKQIQNGANFLFNLQLDGLIVDAQNRWQKLQNNLKRLERAKFIRENQFASLINRAHKHINDAAGLNQTSRRLIIDFLQNRESVELKETSSVDTLSPEITTDLQPRELMENALSNLKSGYEIFIRISSEVKKILRP